MKEIKYEHFELGLSTTSLSGVLCEYSIGEDKRRQLLNYERKLMRKICSEQLKDHIKCVRDLTIENKNNIYESRKTIKEKELNINCYDDCISNLLLCYVKEKQNETNHAQCMKHLKNHVTDIKTKNIITPCKKRQKRKWKERITRFLIKKKLIACAISLCLNGFIFINEMFQKNILVETLGCVLNNISISIKKKMYEFGKTNDAITKYGNGVDTLKNVLLWNILCIKKYEMNRIKGIFDLFLQAIESSIHKSSNCKRKMLFIVLGILLFFRFKQKVKNKKWIHGGMGNRINKHNYKSIKNYESSDNGESDSLENGASGNKGNTNDNYENNKYGNVGNNYNNNNNEGNSNNNNNNGTNNNNNNNNNDDNNNNNDGHDDNRYLNEEEEEEELNSEGKKKDKNKNKWNNRITNIHVNEHTKVDMQLRNAETNVNGGGEHMTNVMSYFSNSSSIGKIPSGTNFINEQNKDKVTNYNTYFVNIKNDNNEMKYNNSMNYWNGANAVSSTPVISGTKRNNPLNTTNMGSQANSINEVNLSDQTNAMNKSHHMVNMPNSVNAINGPNQYATNIEDIKSYPPELKRQKTETFSTHALMENYTNSQKVLLPNMIQNNIYHQLQMQQQIPVSQFQRPHEMTSNFACNEGKQFAVSNQHRIIPQQQQHLQQHQSYQKQQPELQQSQEQPNMYVNQQNYMRIIQNAFPNKQVSLPNQQLPTTHHDKTPLVKREPVESGNVYDQRHGHMEDTLVWHNSNTVKGSNKEQNENYTCIGGRAVHNGVNLGITSEGNFPNGLRQGELYPTELLQRDNAAQKVNDINAYTNVPMNYTSRNPPEDFERMVPQNKSDMPLNERELLNGYNVPTNMNQSNYMNINNAQNTISVSHNQSHGNNIQNNIMQQSKYPGGNTNFVTNDSLIDLVNVPNSFPLCEEHYYEGPFMSSHLRNSVGVQNEYQMDPSSRSPSENFSQDYEHDASNVGGVTTHMQNVRVHQNPSNAQNVHNQSIMLPSQEPYELGDSAKIEEPCSMSSEDKLLQHQTEQRAQTVAEQIATKQYLAQRQMAAQLRMQLHIHKQIQRQNMNMNRNLTVNDIIQLSSLQRQLLAQQGARLAKQMENTAVNPSYLLQQSSQGNAPHLTLQNLHALALQNTVISKLTKLSLQNMRCANISQQMMLANLATLQQIRLAQQRSEPVQQLISNLFRVSAAQAQAQAFGGKDKSFLTAPSSGVSEGGNFRYQPSIEHQHSNDFSKASCKMKTIYETQSEAIERIIKEDIFVNDYHCDVCNKDITHSIRIRCAECTDFDLCVECFSSGKELITSKNSHYNYHNYIPIPKYDFPLYKINWSASEELILLEGISKFGFGNWEQVADMVNTVAKVTKSERECECHYYEFYLKSVSAPLPDNEKLLRRDDGRPFEIQALYEHYETESDDYTVPIVKNNNRTQIVGYWPLRGDFDIEYDNEAELLLADMHFRDTDSPQQKELKLAVLEIYNSKLDDRLFRKRVVIERGLLDNKWKLQKEKRKTRERKELHTFFKPLSRFHSFTQHEAFLQYLIEEQELKHRLIKLHEWKALGLCQAERVDCYELEKEKRIRDVSEEETIEQLECSVKILKIFKREKDIKYIRSNGGVIGRELRTELKEDTNKRNVDFYIKLGLIDESEVRFCKNMNLSVLNYMLIKRKLHKEVCESNDVILSELKYLNTKGHRIGNLYDFFLSFDITERENKPFLFGKKISEAQTEEDRGSVRQREKKTTGIGPMAESGYPLIKTKIVEKEEKKETEEKKEKEYKGEKIENEEKKEKYAAYSVKVLPDVEDVGSAIYKKFNLEEKIIGRTEENQPKKEEGEKNKDGERVEMEEEEEKKEKEERKKNGDEEELETEEDEEEDEEEKKEEEEEENEEIRRMGEGNDREEEKEQQEDADDEEEEEEQEEDVHDKTEKEKKEDDNEEGINGNSDSEKEEENELSVDSEEYDNIEEDEEGYEEETHTDEEGKLEDRNEEKKLLENEKKEKKEQFITNDASSEVVNENDSEQEDLNGCLEMKKGKLKVSEKNDESDESSERSVGKNLNELNELHTNNALANEEVINHVKTKGREHLKKESKEQFVRRCGRTRGNGQRTGKKINDIFSSYFVMEKRITRNESKNQEVKASGIEKKENFENNKVDMKLGSTFNNNSINNSVESMIDERRIVKVLNEETRSHTEVVTGTVLSKGKERKREKGKGQEKDIGRVEGFERKEIKKSERIERMLTRGEREKNNTKEKRKSQNKEEKQIDGKKRKYYNEKRQIENKHGKEKDGEENIGKLIMGNKEEEEDQANEEQSESDQEILVSENEEKQKEEKKKKEKKYVTNNTLKVPSVPLKRRESERLKEITDVQEKKINTHVGKERGKKEVEKEHSREEENKENERDKEKLREKENNKIEVKKEKTRYKKREHEDSESEGTPIKYKKKDRKKEKKKEAENSESEEKKKCKRKDSKKESNANELEEHLEKRKYKKRDTPDGDKGVKNAKNGTVSNKKIKELTESNIVHVITESEPKRKRRKTQKCAEYEMVRRSSKLSNIENIATENNLVKEFKTTLKSGSTTIANSSITIASSAASNVDEKKNSKTKKAVSSHNISSVEEKKKGTERSKNIKVKKEKTHLDNISHVDVADIANTAHISTEVNLKRRTKKKKTSFSSTNNE